VRECIALSAQGCGQSGSVALLFSGTLGTLHPRHAPTLAGDDQDQTGWPRGERTKVRHRLCDQRDASVNLDLHFIGKVDRPVGCHRAATAVAAGAFCRSKDRAIEGGPERNGVESLLIARVSLALDQCGTFTNAAKRSHVALHRLSRCDPERPRPDGGSDR
jgi:hypothetical protein